MNIGNMTAEQRRALLAELAAEQRAERDRRAGDRKAFKEISAEYVERHIDRLVAHHRETERLIASLFDDFNAILALKESVYGARVGGQESHTSTLADGSASVTIGHNVTIGFDGTETAGIEKIKEYLSSLSTEEENNVKLAKAVHRLLRPKAKTGMFNPASIIELSAMREDFGSDLFNEGLDIIIAAQQKRKNSMYVSGWKFVRDAQGRAVKLDFRFTV